MPSWRTSTDNASAWPCADVARKHKALDGPKDLNRTGSRSPQFTTKQYQAAFPEVRLHPGRSHPQLVRSYAHTGVKLGSDVGTVDPGQPACATKHPFTRPQQ